MRARLGQNLLVAPAWQRRVAEAVAAQPDDLILEIGGGRGDVSARLAATGCRLMIVELDPALAAGLRRRFAGQARVEVVEQDILEFDFAALGEGGRRRVFGNLPYYITSPILFRLFAAAALFSDATLMMQKEVAARVAARPGSRDFGLLSAMAQLHARARKLFDVPPGAFRPVPQVTSTLLRLEFIAPLAAPGAETAAFHGFLRAAFAHKRKRLSANLRALAAPPAIAAAFARLGLAPDTRAEQCGVEALLALFRALSAAGATVDPLE